MAQKIENTSLQAFTLSDIASAQAQTGDKEPALATLKQAVEAARKIEKDYAMANALRNIASVLAKMDEKKPALAILKQSMEVAQKIEDASLRAFALMDIISALAMEPVPNKTDEPDRPIVRMKKDFTSEETQLAKQLVEAMQDESRIPVIKSGVYRQLELYDWAVDSGQRTNIVAPSPEIASGLRQKLLKTNTGVTAGVPGRRLK